MVCQLDTFTSSPPCRSFVMRKRSRTRRNESLRSALRRRKKPKRALLMKKTRKRVHHQRESLLQKSRRSSTRMSMVVERVSRVSDPRRRRRPRPRAPSQQLRMEVLLRKNGLKASSRRLKPLKKRIRKKKRARKRSPRRLHHQSLLMKIQNKRLKIQL